MIAISEKISKPVVNMPYLRFLLFILILGSVLQPAPGQELPGVNATPPSSIIGPTLVTRRQRVTEPANEPSHVTSLTFDKEIIYSSCAGKPAAECTDEAAKIKVTAVAEDKENDVVVYSYTVTAGRIMGQGPSVIWDLSGVPAGKYSIIAGSDDGCGICGRTMTKEVEVMAAPDVEKISLSKKEIISWCPNHRGPDSPCLKEGQIVEVTTTATNAHDGLTYYYTVTGGKIIGEGPKVKWDLGDTLLGKYTITAGIGKDDLVLGKIATTDITETECPICDLPCSCPVIEVSGPAGPVNPGDTILFKANVQPASIFPWSSNRNQERISYSWSVSAGTILNDPASSSVMVKIPEGSENESVTAVLTLLNGFSPTCGCPSSGTVTITVGSSRSSKKPIPQLK
jgi:hypothetical protein